MVQLGYRTAEEMCILAWTTLLVFSPHCRLLPQLCDIANDIRVVASLAIFVLVLVVLSQVLPFTRFGKMNPYKDPPLNKPFFVRVADILQRMTLLEGLRVVLGATLPVLGVMLVLQPATGTALCLLKKWMVLEGRMWQRWCPEAYIIFVSLCCTLVIARRSSFSQKVRRHDRYKRQSHAHFYNPDPRFNYGMA